MSAAPTVDTPVDTSVDSSADPAVDTSTKVPTSPPTAGRITRPGRPRAAAETPSPAPPSWRRARPWAVAVAVLGLAALAASGWYLRATSNDAGLQYAALRDTVTVQGRQDIVVMNSLDSAHTSDSVDRWLSVTTGVLHDQLAQMPATQKQALIQSGATSSAQVVDAVVTELDDHAGTAHLIASVELTVVAKDGTAKVVRNRFGADLTLDGQQWKLAQLEQIAVGAS